MNRIVLTGAASGIGRATAHELARRGCSLVLVDRDGDGLRETAAGMQSPAPRLEVVDLSSQARVQALGLSLGDEPVGALINNAGLLCEALHITEDGFELTFAVNTMAPFLLTHLLWPQLVASGDGRVVNVVSLSYRHGRIDFNDLPGTRDFQRYGAYARSKLALLLLTRELARRAGQQPVAVNAVHPGVIGTALGEGGLITSLMKFARPLLKSPKQGAKGLVYLALDADPGLRGQYLVGTAPRPVAAVGRDDETARRLYDELARALRGGSALPPAAPLD
jgi:NAD(P)-dependent dehydrogenase (short-subunit alcohol dehydrogenase family)